MNYYEMSITGKTAMVTGTPIDITLNSNVIKCGYRVGKVGNKSETILSELSTGLLICRRNSLEDCLNFANSHFNLAWEFFNGKNNNNPSEFVMNCRSKIIELSKNSVTNNDTNLTSIKKPIRLI